MELKEIRKVAITKINEVTKENFDIIFDACQLVIRLANICRREGILALEVYAKYIPYDIPLCDLINEMLEMVVDAMEPKDIQELLTVKFVVNNYSELDSFLYFLYARSLLFIQQGASPVQIETFCNTLIPDSIKNQMTAKNGVVFDEQHKIQEERQLEKIQELKNDLSDEERRYLAKGSILLSELTAEEWKVIVGSNGFYGFDKILPYFDDSTKKMASKYMSISRYRLIMMNTCAVMEKELFEIIADLESFIANIKAHDNLSCPIDNVLFHTNEEIQTLIREIDNQTLALALKGANRDIKECFYRNLSVRLKYQLKEAIELTCLVRRCDVEEAQNKILLVMKEVLGWDI